MDAQDLVKLAWLIPACPLAGVVLLWLGRKHIKEPASGWLATAMMGFSFVASVVVFSAMVSLPADERAVNLGWFDWITATGGFSVEVGILADPLSITMALFITGVGSLIHMYSIGYMHGEARYTRFFTYLNLFAFSMLVLVLGGNYLVTFVGWEGVGLCSYLLISFYNERPSAARAGKKAFVANRVGDFGFMVAMFLMFAHFGTLEITSVLHLAEEGMAGATATGIALMLFLAASGKSAQGPLFVWLPDAMEGPTPVSALIHAATMVTSGVYLMSRSFPFLEQSAVSADVVAWVGAITAIVAATIALTATDIKRVLAYSTISQLGYMFLAVGVGAYVAALFHMITHAFFKALLFLGAGSVIHGMHEEQDMRRMGALRKLMPVTAGTFIVAWLAIAGMVPLAGFWSKDEILAAAFISDQYALWAVGAVTALITAFYMTRQVYLVFYGNERWHEVLHGRKPHESSAVMTFPLVVLAGLTVLGGILNLPFKGWQRLAEWLHPVFHGVEEPHPESFMQGFTLSTVAVLLGVIGIVGARAFYRNGLASATAPDPIERKLGPLTAVFSNGWYIDSSIAAAVDRPVRAGSQALAGPVDQGVVDGAVNGTAAVVAIAGRFLRKAQTGFLRNYALAIFGGGAMAMFFLLFRARFSRTAMDDYYLSALILIPAAGAAVVPFLTRTRPEFIKGWAISVSLVVALVTAVMLVDFERGQAGFQFVEDHQWIEALGIRYVLGVDGISLFMIALTALLFPISLLASVKIDKKVPVFFGFMLLLEAALMGVFLAVDLFLFFVFWEVVLIPMYFIIGIWGYDRRIYAALKFFLYTALGSAFLLAGILTLAYVHARVPGTDLTFDLRTLMEWDGLSSTTAKWLFFAFFASFAVKVPLFPLHTWLPDAHVQAPTAGSVLLAGLLLKLGTYGFLRFSLTLFPQAAVDFAPLLLTLATIGIIYGAIVAAMQKDLKKLVAYSSVAHLGFVVLGIFALTTPGLQGGVFTMVSHGLTTGALFLLVGILYERRHTREIDAFGGVWKAAPKLGGIFLAITFASIGLPGLSGFVGEFLALIGTFVVHRPYAIVATAGVILAAVYMLWGFQRVFTGEPTGENATIRDLDRREMATVAPLLALSLFLGVYPKPLLERVEPSVKALIEHVEDRSDYEQPEAAQ